MDCSRNRLLKDYRYACKFLLNQKNKKISITNCNRFLEYFLKKYKTDSNCIEDIARTFLSIKKQKTCLNKLKKCTIPDIKNRINNNNQLLLFAILFTYYRRFKQVTEMKELIEQFKNLENYAFYMHALAMYHEKEIKDLDSSIKRYKDALNYEQQAIKKDKNYIYAKHKYADIVAKLLENGLKPNEKCDSITTECIPEKYIHTALDYLEDVLKERPEYARAYYTRAQIELSLGNLSKAERDIMNAIDYEDPDSVDYYNRITDYFILRQNIRLVKRINLKFNEIINKMIYLEKDIVEQTERKFSYLIAIISILLTFVFVTSQNINEAKIVIVNSLILYFVILTTLIIYHLLEKNTKIK